MKKILLQFAIICIFSVNLSGQYAYAPDFVTGDLVKVDLGNPTNQVIIGKTVNSIGGADFGPGNILYAITSQANQFYIIDTSNAATTLVGSSVPLAGHMWSGLAYDPTSSLFFASSTTGNTESAIYTIEVSTGTATHIGTTNVAESVVDISFDPGGMMYAYDLSNNIFLIDKSNGSASLLGNAGTHGGLQWHGMGYSYFYNEMYISTYNSITWDITLRSVDLTSGNTTSLGSIGIAAGDLAMVHSAFNAPIISTNTDSVMFDTTLIPLSSQRILAIYNKGNDTLKVTDIISYDTAFTLNITNFEVLPGDSQLVQINFTPKTAVFYSTYINIISNDPQLGTLSIYLSGTGEIATGLNTIEDTKSVNIYPNPFINCTTISYFLNKPSNVIIRIFDLSGRVVNTLVNEFQDKGNKSIVWRGRDQNNIKLKTGVYVYMVEISGVLTARRITIIK